jgi:hypothetical protein
MYLAGDESGSGAFEHYTIHRVDFDPTAANPDDGLGNFLSGFGDDGQAVVGDDVTHVRAIEILDMVWRGSNLYMCGRGGATDSGTVWKATDLTDGGSIVWSWTPGDASSVDCIAVDSSGDVYAVVARVGGFSVVKLSGADGSWAGEWDAGNNLNDLEIDDSDRLYVTGPPSSTWTGSGGATRNVWALDTSLAVVWSAQVMVTGAQPLGGSPTSCAVRRSTGQLWLVQGTDPITLTRLSASGAIERESAIGGLPSSWLQVRDIVCQDATGALVIGRPAQQYDAGILGVNPTAHCVYYEPTAAVAWGWEYSCTGKMTADDW